MSKDFDIMLIPAYIPYGRKPAYSIKLSKDLLKDLNFRHIADDIKNFILDIEI